MGFKRHLLPLLTIGLFLLLSQSALADDWASEDAAAEPEEGPPLIVEEPAPPPQVAPVVLKIPAIGVEADIFPVGMDAEGAMDVPPHPDAVAWWEPGAGTGFTGNVVLAAHVDWGGRLRVFGLLHRLRAGDQIVVVDEQLREFFYEVTSSHWVPAEGAPVEEIFANNGTAEVTLITCGGQFDSASRQYLDRLIVKAKQV